MTHGTQGSFIFCGQLIVVIVIGVNCHYTLNNDIVEVTPFDVLKCINSKYFICNIQGGVVHIETSRMSAFSRLGAIGP